MSKKIKLLFISQHVVNNSIYQAGHQSFNYYLSKFCNDEAFEIGYIVEHNREEAFFKMKAQFHKANDFSIPTPRWIRILKYIFYNSILKHVLSTLNPVWLYLNPFRAFVYKKALSKLNDQGWIPDIVASEWTEMLFLIDYCRQLFCKAAFLATEHDLSYQKLFRQYDKNILFKKLVLERFKTKEISILKELDLIILLSYNDLKLLKLDGVDKRQTLLITPYFNRTNRKQKEIKPNVIFFGAMNRPENQAAVKWFIDNVFKPYQLYNLVSFIVVGAGIPSELKKQYESINNLTFTGFVERPEEYFESALCMVVPLTYGGGIKIKVLEAMSNSVAVLSNTTGIEGINAKPDVSYIHCSQPFDYYIAIHKLTNDFNKARHIGEAGRKLIENTYNFEKSYKEYRNKIIQLHIYKNNIKHKNLQ